METKTYTVWFRYGDNEKDCYNISLTEDCEDPLTAAKKLDSRIYKVD